MEIKSGILTPDCCSCNNCVESCPSSAISMKSAALGTLVASVDATKCIGCGKCEKVCPVINPPSVVLPKAAYAGVSFSPMANHSTSGGMFYEIANYLLKQQYYVYGASFTEDLGVAHKEISKIEDLHYLQGSKYVKSDTTGINRKVAEHLKNGERVLFSGTPCQVASLYNYLPTSVPLDNLVTVDVICHGTPSVTIFQQHCHMLEEQKNRRIQKIVFRDRSFGHKHIGRIHYEPKKYHSKSSIYYSDEDSYFKLFLKGITYNDGCYRCFFATRKRCSDITIGDFWGVKKEMPVFFVNNNISQETSISAMMANSEKGLQIINAINNENLLIEQVEYEKIARNNPQLNSPMKISETERKRIIDAYEREGYEGIEKYFQATTNYTRYLMRISSYVPNFVKNIIKKNFLNGS